MVPTLALAASLLVLAQPEPRRIEVKAEPVEITAEGGLAIDLDRRVGVAKGGVVIRRGDVYVCCDEAEAAYSGERVEEVTCRGRVVVVRPDGTRATADLAVFRADADRVTLKGGAHVASREADLRGETIVYDITKDRLEVRGPKSRFEFKPASRAPVGRACPPAAGIVDGP